jgi:hypothetical protein
MTVAPGLLSRLTALPRYAGSLAWDPLLELSRSNLVALLKRIEDGELEILDFDGTTIHCGGHSGEGAPKTSLRVHNEIFWARLLIFADMVRTS